MKAGSSPFEKGEVFWRTGNRYYNCTEFIEGCAENL